MYTYFGGGGGCDLRLLYRTATEYAPNCFIPKEESSESGPENIEENTHGKEREELECNGY